MTDISSGKVPILACWRAAWAFLLQNWRTFLPAAAAAAAVSQIGAAATMLMSSGAAIQSPMVAFVASIPAILAGLMFTAAVMRKAVRDEFVKPIGLALGADERRLFGVGISVVLLAIPIVLLGAIIMSVTLLRAVAPTPAEMEALAADPEAMAEAMVKALGPMGVQALQIGFTVVVGLALGFVALADAATIGERRVLVFQAWSWIRGNILRVLAVILMTATPVLLLNGAITELALGLLVGMSGGQVSVLPYLIVLTLVSFISSIISIPIPALGATLYKGLRPPDFAAK